MKVIYLTKKNKKVVAFETIFKLKMQEEDVKKELEKVHKEKIIILEIKGKNKNEMSIM